LSGGELLSSRRRDYRLLGIVGVVSITAMLGYLFNWLVEPGGDVHKSVRDSVQTVLAQKGFDHLQPSAAGSDPGEEVETESEKKTKPPSSPATGARSLFLRGRKEVDQKKYDQALDTLERAIALRPKYAEAYAAGGYALLGKNLPDNARTAFLRAIEMNPGLADAYFGAGIAFDALGDQESAIGAMRSYLHLTSEKDPYNATVVRARAAIWELESHLGRGPWGSTRGIPPGLSEADVRRDGKGVGMMTPQPDGTSRALPPPENQNKK
jgi:hypothetical protein